VPEGKDSGSATCRPFVEYAGGHLVIVGGGQHRLRIVGIPGLHQPTVDNVRQRFAGSVAGPGSKASASSPSLTRTPAKTVLGFFHIPQASAADAGFYAHDKAWPFLDDSLGGIAPGTPRSHFALSGSME